jgi:hypothetical protein
MSSGGRGDQWGFDLPPGRIGNHYYHQKLAVLTQISSLSLAKSEIGY